MVLTDRELRTLNQELTAQNKPLISDAKSDQFFSIGYDLTTSGFYVGQEAEKSNISLAPNDSVFVKSKEVIDLPSDVMAYVSLRNSRIRQGLSLTAPIYQPGHKTNVYFRITNVSKQAIKLDCTKGIASILFVKLDLPVDKPYAGGFQSEFDYRGLGDYTSTLSKDMVDIEKKVENVKDIEKNMYGNVLAIMGIFVAIFSLINVNVSLATAENVTMKMLLTMNFSTVTAIGFLIALIRTFFPNGKHKCALWIACAVAFVATVVLQFIL